MATVSEKALPLVIPCPFFSYAGPVVFVKLFLKACFLRGSSELVISNILSEIINELLTPKEYKFELE